MPVDTLEKVKEVNKDKAGENYWTNVWQNVPLPDSFNYKLSSINNYPNRVFHENFKKMFAKHDLTRNKLLEIGCGNSVLLEYLALEFGFDVTGIDYSRFGCEQARRILQRSNIKGSIVETDAFNPPENLLRSFDVVCSFGVVEHFEDTVSTLKMFSNYLKPNGLLITSVPNMAGISGQFHKWFNKSIYDIHVPMDKKYLDDAIEKAGLIRESSNYFISFTFDLVLHDKDNKKISYYLPKKIFIKTLRYFAKIVWFLENIFGQLPAGKLFSGGIFSAARKL